ncbi:hypothetical protein HSB1_39470 [Halogranum salarium B-1]|uniref:Uncharacterized protein n=1 Tax=Halogranum salarium B-1 TaxID=1210908 RepID=J3JDL2_9EURY|nr:hypothetical protein HSB1_39470 [Halogranum salarium B-1]
MTVCQHGIGIRRSLENWGSYHAPATNSTVPDNTRNRQSTTTPPDLAVE